VTTDLPTDLPNHVKPGRAAGLPDLRP